MPGELSRVAGCGVKAQPFLGASEPRILDGSAGSLAQPAQVLHGGSHSCLRGGRTEAQDMIPLSFCLEAVIFRDIQQLLWWKSGSIPLQLSQSHGN